MLFLYPIIIGIKNKGNFNNISNVYTFDIDMHICKNERIIYMHICIYDVNCISYNVSMYDVHCTAYTRRTCIYTLLNILTQVRYTCIHNNTLANTNTSCNNQINLQRKTNNSRAVPTTNTGSTTTIQGQGRRCTHSADGQMVKGEVPLHFGGPT